MEKISKIDPFSLELSKSSKPEKKRLRQEKWQQEKEAGYQQLTELCCLGEYDMATQLANKNSLWGYEIINGEIMEINSY